jgi:hypothetical protein
MDDESNRLLREILDLQREQTELLKKHLPPLWIRVRFTLLGLLILMTLLAVALGFTVVSIRTLNKAVQPSTPRTGPTGNDDGLFGGFSPPAIHSPVVSTLAPPSKAP